MSDRAPRFTMAELSRVAVLAKEKGVAVRLARDGSILILPEPPRLDIAGADDLDDELQRWEQRQGARN